MGKRATLRASTLRPRPLEEKAAHRARDGAPRAAALRSAARCACRSPRPTRSTRSREAYERFAAGGKLGKIVLELRVNAAERLWRGLARHDWEAVRAQFHASAVIERAGDGTRLDVEDYIAAHRVAAARGEGEIEVLRSVIDGRAAVIEARVGERRCAGIYDLHDGRIAGAIEYWAPLSPEVFLQRVLVGDRRPRSCAWIVHSAGPPDSSTCSSSRSVNLAPHSSQRSPTCSRVFSSRSMAPHVTRLRGARTGRPMRSTLGAEVADRHQRDRRQLGVEQHLRWRPRPGAPTSMPTSAARSRSPRRRA